MEWRFTTHRPFFQIFLFLLLLLSFLSFSLSAQSPCYKAIKGKGVTAVPIQGGVVCVNCNTVSNPGNLTDADDQNYAAFNSTTILAGSGISVADTFNTYSAGWHAGFLISVDSAFLSASVLSSFTLSTYLDGVFRESRTNSTGLQVSLLGKNSGKMYLSFVTTQTFDEVRLTLSSALSTGHSFRVYNALAFDPTCGISDNNSICYDQIAGPSTMLTYNGGLANALVTLTNENNITDGDKNSFATLNLPLGISLLSTPPYVGVIEKELVHPAGNRTGFVIGYNSSLLTADVLNAISIQTYLHGQFRENASFNNGAGLVNVRALASGSTSQKELSFVTSMSFNEVRLVLSQGINTNIGSVNIFYAFESGNACPSVTTPLLSSQSAPDIGSLNASRTGTFGLLCVGQSLTGTNNVVNANAADYATFTPATLSVGCGARISVKNDGTDYPTGTFAGFTISKQGGLIDLNLLTAITINVYKDGGANPVASSSGTALLQSGLLQDDDSISTIGFSPGTAFDEIQIVFNSGLIAANLGGNYRIYSAFVIKDSDGDSVPDPVDICPGNDALDTDGDGMPNDCDACSQINGKSVYADTDGDGVKDACDADTDDDGIADAVEDRNLDGNFENDDADGDGLANHLDLDSDDDGLTDLAESGISASLLATLDADNNGVIDLAIARGSNGMANGVESSDMPLSGNSYLLLDTDGDSVPNFVDLDADNDGINEVVEGYSGLFADANGDGMVDGPDTDRDGIRDVVDGSPARGNAGLNTIADTDNDGIPDFKDLDSDNDLISDLVESGQTGYTDADQNGVADGPDTDGDGIVDGLDGNNGEFGDANQLPPVNTDSDSEPDYADTDSNNDGIKDIVDNGNGWQDLNGDGAVDNALDSDGDGIANNNGSDLDPIDFGGLGIATQLNTKLLLQGALTSASDTLMRDDLRQQNLLPFAQPYNAALSTRFTTAGGGGDEMTSSSALSVPANANNAIVDWVFIELRKSYAPATVVRTISALLQRDGDVVGADGNKLGVIVDTGSYFLSVKHRNHLGTMTATAVVVAGTPAMVDFRSSATLLYGTNSTRTLSSGKRALHGGNVNMDATLYYTAPGNDRDALLNSLSGNQVGYLNGYNAADLNLDGQIFLTAPGNDRDWMLAEPLSGNELGFIQEQLP